MLLMSCGSESGEALSENDKTPTLSAADIGEQVVLSTTQYLQSEPYLEADRNNGKRQAMLCMACHSLDEGGPNMIGPALHGMFGRRAGGVDRFVYSPVLRDSEFIWTPVAMDAWLAEPASFLPGNRMAFVGIRNSHDRRDLIAYLLQQTSATNE